MSKSQTKSCLIQGFQNKDYHTGGLIVNQNTKRYRDNQFQSLEHPFMIPYLGIHLILISPMLTSSIHLMLCVFDLTMRPQLFRIWKFVWLIYPTLCSVYIVFTNKHPHRVESKSQYRMLRLSLHNMEMPYYGQLTYSRGIVLAWKTSRWETVLFCNDVSH